MFQPTNTRTLSLSKMLPLVALGLLACGGGGGGSGAFEVNNTVGSVTAGATMVVRGPLAVYFAEEAVTGPPGGAGLNSDLDKTDKVARVVTITSRTDVLTGVAALSAEILNGEVYLEVSEAQDSVDWDMDAVADDRVLLHFDRNTESASFVATLPAVSRGLPFVVAGGRLYYTAKSTGLTGDETSLFYIESNAPLVSKQVSNTLGDGTLSPHILAEDEGLIFLLLDESVEGRSLNSDADSTDASVLALLDGNTVNAPIKSTGLAMFDENEPLDAKLTGVNDWTVAFLVDEADQGGVSLNDQSSFTNPILVASCAGMNDTDASDRVLHYIEFATFMTGATGPINTGLAGTDRVIAFDGAVATLSLESDSGCDLNEDTDMGDTIVRWTSTDFPVAPTVAASEMHDIVTGIAGGSHGIGSLDNRLIGIVSEAGDQKNFDMRSDDNDLVAWVDPTFGNAAVWTFRHQSSSNPTIGTGIFEDTNGDGIGDPGLGASEPYAGASWLAPEPTFGRLGVAFQESVPGSNPQVPTLNTNLLCSFFQKDLDKVDSLPVWMDFEPGPVLDFDGVGFAVNSANAGVRTQSNAAFFVVDEAADNTDYNGDADFSDTLLFRNPTNQCNPILMSPLRALGVPVMGPVLHTDSLNGALFIAEERAAGMDLNGDNDTLDFVVRYFRF